MKQKDNIQNKKALNNIKSMNAKNVLKSAFNNKSFNNILKNIKISTLVLIMSTFSALFILIIGIIGSFSMNNINKSMASIYNNNLIPITTGTEIRSSFLNMETFTIQGIFNYDYTVDSQINLYKQKVKNYLTQYEKNKMSKFEEENLNNFKGVYSKYLSLWNNERAKLLKGETVPTSDYINFVLLGKKAEDCLMAISNYNKQTAKNVINNGSRQISATTNNMTFLTIASVLISIILSTVVILMMKRYSKELINTMETIAEGDFRVNIDTDSKKEFGIMKNYLHKTLAKIEDMIKSIKEKSINIDKHTANLYAISEEMSAYSQKTAHTISEVAGGTSSQAEKLVEILNTISDFSLKLDDIVNAIDTVTMNSNGINNVTNQSSSNMNFLIESVSNVSNSFKYFELKLSNLSEDISKINAITNVINSLSDQTNLLSLNAAIEAARAGESGKGFSIVADQIRKLSEQSKNSSGEINKLINDIVNHSKDILNTTNKMNEEINAQVKVINNSITFITNIIDSVNKMAPQIGSINSSASEISKDKNNILGKIQEVSAIAEEVSASTQDISVSAEKVHKSSSDIANSSQALSDMTTEMMKHVDKFKLEA